MTRLIASLAALLISLPAIAGDLRVGFGNVDVTPELGKKPVFMAGFGENRLAVKVHDPIMARAVVFDDGKTKIAMACVDVVGIFNESVTRIRKQLPGFTYVMVSASHNHEGPDTLGLWGPNPFTSGVNPEYMKQMEAGVVAAVKQAEAALAPAEATFGTAAAADLIRDGRLPKVIHDTLVVLSFTNPTTKKRTGLLVQWNNHPEDMDSKNTELTTDFPGVVVGELQKKYGCPVAYFTGTVGGLMTSLGVEVKDETGKPMAQGTFPRTQRYGQLVAERAGKAIDSAVPVSLTPLNAKRQEILLPMDNMLYRLAWQAGTLNRDMYEWHGIAAPKEFKPTKDISKPVASKTELGLIKLGEVEIAVIPGEIYPELVLGKVQDPVDPGSDFPDAAIEPAIYAQMKSKHKMIIGLGNDELGYFIPKRQWDEKKPFCYGLAKTQYGEVNSVGPEAAPIICNEFQKLAVGDEPAKPSETSPVLKHEAAIAQKIKQMTPDLIGLYEHLHANPELSYREEKSSALMAAELRKLGFEVTEKVGGFGVVGVFKNGPGPTILVRTDTDALPVTEKTGLPYASKVRTKDKAGNDVGAMHACGHDMHMTCWVGTARTLTSMKDAWSGTLVFIAQPAEEVGGGARAMLADGLFKRFPKPDFCLALHCDANTPIGQIRYNDGLAMANVDSVDMLVKGKGGHGAAPHTTVDPIVLSARIVLDLQTIVSRETNPTEPVVVTVGSIHGGTKHNIIPNEVKMQLTVRTTNDATRDRVLKSIDRIAKAAAVAANAPAPEVKVELNEFTPALVNDAALTKKTTDLFKQMLGEANVKTRVVVMGGEDFSQYGRAGSPVCMYFLGTVDSARYDESVKNPAKVLPSTHNDTYAPIPEPSMALGVRTMSMAVLNLCGKK